MSPDAWWKNGIFYEIYPRSLQDSDADGTGDLSGIRRRLDYLDGLGVDALWICPIFPSPMADFGYDIADYCDIDPRFGTLAEFDALVGDIKARGLKLILDLVPNHTSDRHPWFMQSRSARDDPRRDWYLWRDPAPDGGPPNNWLSNFGGPAWTFDEATGQYYGHSFLKEQPDLNWRNPAVRTAMYDVMRFWLRRGIDGFRVDVLYHLIKDDRFRDNPSNPAFTPGAPESHRLLPLYTTDRPEMQEIVVEMRRVVDEFSDAVSARVLIGELHLPLERLMAYYGRSENGVLQGVQLPFNFQLIRARWEAGEIRRIVRNYDAALPPGAAPNWVLGNHDESRVATRVGPRNARLAAMLLLTLRGTPTLYYGDEIGLPDTPISAADVRDPFEMREPGKGLGRDPQRTPMPWSAAQHAGFSSVRPWLPLGEDWPKRNVEAMDRDPESILALYRRLIALRRQEAALHSGTLDLLESPGDVLAYDRAWGERRLRVLLNFSDDESPLEASHLDADADILASTVPGRAGVLRRGAALRPREGVVLSLRSPRDDTTV